ncbi:MAG: hypothetical protein ACTHNA_00505 [Sphingopyxis terrae]|uniref:hypothetical protein n=1 Tax=Sphingopyxis terrae TaxID=33052 RepID=UPI003F809DCC
MSSTAIWLAKRTLAALVIIPLGVGIGKAIEYGTVDYLGDRLGFDGAAMIGTAIFVALALYCDRRWKRWSAKRQNSGTP